MRLWARIRVLSIGQLARLSVIFLKKPLLIIPTLRATKQTFKICNARYGKSHHGRNKANAFRHALWNILICQKAMKTTKNKQKSVLWAQKVTHLYEKVTQNEMLDSAMDLHNNGVGRICFLNTLGQNEDEIIKYLESKIDEAVQIDSVKEIERARNRFVYLEA